MRQPTVLFAALLTFSIAGCKQADAPHVAGESTPAKAVEATKAPSILSVDPAEMPACDKRTRSATVRWDATRLANVSPPFEIWVSYPNKEPRLFARTASKGEKQTGKWIVAGVSFSLKNSDGSVIGNVEVAGIPCD